MRLVLIAARWTILVGAIAITAPKVPVEASWCEPPCPECHHPNYWYRGMVECANHGGVHDLCWTDQAVEGCCDHVATICLDGYIESGENCAEAWSSYSCSDM